MPATRCRHPGCLYMARTGTYCDYHRKARRAASARRYAEKRKAERAAQPPAVRTPSPKVKAARHLKSVRAGIQRRLDRAAALLRRNGYTVIRPARQTAA